MPHTRWSATPNDRPPWWLWPQVVSLDGGLVAVAWLLLIYRAQWSGNFGPFEGSLACMAFGLALLCGTTCSYALDRALDARRLPHACYAQWPFRYRFWFGQTPRWIAFQIGLPLVALFGVFALTQLFQKAHWFLIPFFAAGALALWLNEKGWPLKEPAVALIFASTLFVLSDGCSSSDASPAQWYPGFLLLCMASALHSSLHQAASDQVLDLRSLATAQPLLAKTLFRGTIGALQVGWWLTDPLGPALALTALVLLGTHPRLLRVESQTGTALGDFAMAGVPLAFLALA
ncbi:MAG: hypothetical protein ACFBZ8_10265 [Opitutales bacterium]